MSCQVNKSLLSHEGKGLCLLPRHQQRTRAACPCFSPGGVFLVISYYSQAIAMRRGVHWGSSHTGGSRRLHGPFTHSPQDRPGLRAPNTPSGGVFSLQPSPMAGPRVIFALTGDLLLHMDLSLFGTENIDSRWPL